MKWPEEERQPTGTCARLDWRWPSAGCARHVSSGGEWRPLGPLGALAGGSSHSAFTCKKAPAGRYPSAAQPQLSLACTPTGGFPHRQSGNRLESRRPFSTVEATCISTSPSAIRRGSLTHNPAPADAAVLCCSMVFGDASGRPSVHLDVPGFPERHRTCLDRTDSCGRTVARSSLFMIEERGADSPPVEDPTNHERMVAWPPAPCASASTGDEASGGMSAYGRVPIPNHRLSGDEGSLAARTLYVVLPPLRRHARLLTEYICSVVGGRTRTGGFWESFRCFQPVFSFLAAPSPIPTSNPRREGRRKAALESSLARLSQEPSRARSPASAQAHAPSYFQEQAAAISKKGEKSNGRTKKLTTHRT